jgi:hypothetical protein
MAASFIKKSDGNFYLRLTGDTTSVKFAAVSNAGNTYTFSVDGNVVVSKPNGDPNTYYSSSANPIPSGGSLDDGFFPGSETVYTYSGSGTRDYLLSFTSSGAGTGTQFYLGGASLTWGGYAYPGDGYISNPLAVGIKKPASIANTGTLTHIFDNVNNTNTLINGTGATFVNQNPDAPDGVPCDSNNFNYSQKYYTVYWNTAFPNSNYTLNITILDNQSASGDHAGFINLCSIANKTASSFDIQFYASDVNGISYVRSFSASASYESSWSNAGNIFIKNGGSWKEVQNAWIKRNGSWTKVFQNFGNSSWINMLEGTDDAIDFGIQVIPIQTIPVWVWPISNSTGSGDFYPAQVVSNGTSSVITPPNSQSVTLNVSLSPGFGGSGAYTSMLLRRISDSSVIWSYELYGSTSSFYSTNVTFNVTADESYQFESTAIVPSGSIGANSATVRRSDNQTVYENTALVYYD